MNRILLIIRNKRTDLHRSALLFALVLFLILMAGCTVDDPGYVAVSNTPDVTVVDSDGNIIEIDEATGAITMIEYEHHEIHAGDSFKADINTDDIQTEGVNNALHISFTTPNTTEWAHLVIYGWAGGGAELSIVEAPGGGVAGGANLAIFNRNRNSSETSTLISTDDTATNEMTQDATVPIGGTEIHHWKLGAGKNKIGGDTRGNEEFILQQNTTYSIRMTSTNANIPGQLTLEWYEHVNR